MSVLPHIEEPPRTTGLGFSLDRVKIRNYKSIAYCDVKLGRFTLLVGRNGSGKSNFLDALQFVADALLQSPSDAVRSRTVDIDLANRVPVLGEIYIELGIVLAEGSRADYLMRLVPKTATDIIVKEETLTIRGQGADLSFRCKNGELRDESGVLIEMVPEDRLHLVDAAKRNPACRPVLDVLSAMKVYDLHPSAMRKDRGEPGEAFLARDGGNLVSVLERIEKLSSDLEDWILPYLRKIVPEVEDLRTRPFPTGKMIEFKQNGVGRTLPTPFMSDGTLRALGVLVAINQLASDGRPIRIVGIEEPETALHPAAAGALMEALREASTHTQVLVTTHSADLLDCFDPETDGLLLASMSRGATRLSLVDAASRRILQKHLDTAGGLLRMDQLEPDPADLKRQSASPAAPHLNGDS